MSKRKPAVEVYTPTPINKYKRKPLGHVPIPRPEPPTWVEWLIIAAVCGVMVAGIWTMVLTIQWMLE